MRTRILPAEEFAKLADVEMPVLHPYVPPRDIDVVVVEDDAGKVIASMNVFRATHFEGAWIAPGHRTAGVTRALLRMVNALAAARGASWVFATAEHGDARMLKVLDRLKGVQMPVEMVVLPVGGEEWLRQQ